MIVFSFLVSLKSPDFPDPLAAVTLIENMYRINIGITGIHAFNKPILKAGISEIFNSFFFNKNVFINKYNLNTKFNIFLFKKTGKIW